MTITQAPTAPTPQIMADPSAVRRGTSATANGRIGRILRSEWTKLRTVRSTYWTLVGAAVAMVGFAAILCAVYVAQFDTLTVRDKATFNPVSFSLFGAGFAQLAIGVLGVLTISNEYASGMIRTTLAATPQRLVVLAAKAAVSLSLDRGIKKPPLRDPGSNSGLSG